MHHIFPPFEKKVLKKLVVSFTDKQKITRISNEITRLEEFPIQEKEGEGKRESCFFHREKGKGGVVPFRGKGEEGERKGRSTPIIPCAEKMKTILHKAKSVEGSCC